MKKKKKNQFDTLQSLKQYLAKKQIFSSLEAHKEKLPTPLVGSKGLTSEAIPSNSPLGELKLSHLPSNTTMVKKVKTALPHGAHIGHKPINLPVSRAWLPSMGDCLAGERNGVALLNSHLTLEGTAKGLYLSAAILRRGGHILVIDTRFEDSPLLALMGNSNDSIPSSLSFSGSRWIGGTLSNWDSISVMVRRSAQISKGFATFLLENRIYIPRYEKMRQAFPGFLKRNQRPTPSSPSIAEGETLRKGDRFFRPTRKEGELPSFNQFPSKGVGPLLGPYEGQLRYKRCPDLLWILNPNQNRGILEEAERLRIPTIGIVDSNTDLSSITVSIPLNTNAPFWGNQLITTLIALSRSLTPSKGVKTQ